MIDRRERYRDEEEQLRTALDGMKSGLWTALPGIIKSLSIVGGAPFAAVQPAVMAMMVTDGGLKPANLPILPHCPVWFPRGGGCSLTFPVQPDDECMLVFSSRALDGWWQSGAAQPPADLRSHDLSDAIAYVGLTSSARPLQGISTTSTQLRSDDGTTLLDLNPSTRTITLGGMLVQVDANLQVNGTITATGNVTAGSVDLEHHVHINGGGTGLSGQPQG